MAPSAEGIAASSSFGASVPFMAVHATNYGTASSSAGRPPPPPGLPAPPAPPSPAARGDESDEARSAQGTRKAISQPGQDESAAAEWNSSAREPDPLPTGYNDLLAVHQHTLFEHSKPKKPVEAKLKEACGAWNFAKEVLLQIAMSEGIDPKNVSGEEVQEEQGSVGLKSTEEGQPANFVMAPNLEGEELAQFNKYRERYLNEARYPYAVGYVGDANHLDKDRLKELAPRIQSVMRHGTPMAPVPMCSISHPSRGWLQ